MTNAVRFGVSISSDLLVEFDGLIAEKGYTNRSEALRDMIRSELVEREALADGEVAGTVTLIYDHHVRELSDRLLKMAHDDHSLVLSAMHVHLDHDNGLEVIALKGEGRRVRVFADRLIGTRGVKHGRLVITSTGCNLPE